MTCDSCGFRNNLGASSCAICAKIFAVATVAATAKTFSMPGYTSGISYGEVPVNAPPPSLSQFQGTQGSTKPASRNGFRKGVLLGRWGAAGGLLGDIVGDLLSDRIAGNSKTILAMLLSVGIWFAFVGAGISIAIALGQSRYLGRKAKPWKTLAISGMFGFFAAFVAGDAAQLAYSIIGPTELLRDICWGLAGCLMGAALSFRIPNLGFWRGLGGGLAGGLLGGGLFIAAAYTVSDVIGRYIGCAAIGFLIALMIVVSEALFREAWIEIRYGPKEVRTVSLGSQAVTFGSDASKCTVFVRGVAPIAKSFSLRDKRISLLDVPSGKTTYPIPGSVEALGNVEIMICGA